MNNEMNLNFKIEGEFITHFAREKYKETNDLSIGVKFLTQALVGFPVDLAILFGPGFMPIVLYSFVVLVIS